MIEPYPSRNSDIPIYASFALPGLGAIYAFEGEPLGLCYLGEEEQYAQSFTLIERLNTFWAWREQIFVMIGYGDMNLGWMIANEYRCIYSIAFGVSIWVTHGTGI